MTRLNVLPATSDDLGRVEIATPCDVPWESLAGDNRVRHCGRCRQNVYNVEAMARDEALLMIGAREGRLCLRIFRRSDGTVVTSDCWSRLRTARQKGVWAFLAMLVVVGWAEITAIMFGLNAMQTLMTNSTMGSIPRPPSIPASPFARDPDVGFVTLGEIGPMPDKLSSPSPVERPREDPERMMGLMRRR